MNLFRSENPSEKAALDERRCPRCDAKPKLIYSMLDPLSGRTVRMSECVCGERTWIDRT